MPRALRDLRAKLLLSRFAAHLGVPEVKCRACGGSGLLDRGEVEVCPICRGFAEVPRSLEDWFVAEMFAAQAAASGRHAKDDEVPEPDEPRFGLCGERFYRAELPICDFRF